jgi:hypothetical protein
MWSRPGRTDASLVRPSPKSEFRWMDHHSTRFSAHPSARALADRTNQYQHARTPDRTKPTSDTPKKKLEACGNACFRVDFNNLAVLLLLRSHGTAPLAARAVLSRSHFLPVPTHERREHEVCDHLFSFKMKKRNRNNCINPLGNGHWAGLHSTLVFVVLINTPTEETRGETPAPSGLPH